MSSTRRKRSEYFLAIYNISRESAIPIIDTKYALAASHIGNIECCWSILLVDP